MSEQSLNFDYLEINEILAKANVMTVPTKTSDLENDSGFITNSALSGYSKNDLSNVDNDTFAAKATSAGVGSSSPTVFNLTINTSNWGDTKWEGWYGAMINAPGMSATYNPIMDLVITSAELAPAEKAAYSQIMECETGDLYVIFKALEKPTISLNVRLTVV